MKRKERLLLTPLVLFGILINFGWVEIMTQGSHGDSGTVSIVSGCTKIECFAIPMPEDEFIGNSMARFEFDHPDNGAFTVLEAYTLDDDCSNQYASCNITSGIGLAGYYNLEYYHEEQANTRIEFIYD